MSLTVPDVVYRSVKGAALSAAEHDANLEVLVDFCNGLAALVGVSLNSDGSLRYPNVDYVTGAGTETAFTGSITLNPPTAFADVTGRFVFLVAPVANGDNPTFDYCSLGAKYIKKYGGSNLALNDMAASRVAVLRYDLGADHWELMNPATTPWLTSVTTANLPAGSGLRVGVQQAVKTDVFTITSAPPTFEDVTGLSVQLNRISTTSKAFVNVVLQASGLDGHGPMFRLTRVVGATETDLCLGAASSSRTRISAAGPSINADQYTPKTVAIQFLDELSGIEDSTVTYKIKAAVWTGPAAVNGVSAGYDTDAAYTGRTASTITVEEVL